MLSLDKYFRYRDSRSRFFVFVGGEKGLDGKVYPFAIVNENGNIDEGKYMLLCLITAF